MHQWTATDQVPQSKTALQFTTQRFQFTHITKSFCTTDHLTGLVFKNRSGNTDGNPISFGIDDVPGFPDNGFAGLQRLLQRTIRPAHAGTEYIGTSSAHRLNTRIFTEFAWHGAFIRHLLRRPDPKDLANFQPEEEYVLEPGDMLYLPPRWAHDGVAVGECMTYSIGFRQPARGELARELLQKRGSVGQELRTRVERLQKAARFRADDDTIPAGSLS